MCKCIIFEKNVRDVLPLNPTAKFSRSISGKIGKFTNYEENLNTVAGSPNLSLVLCRLGKDEAEFSKQTTA